MSIFSATDSVLGERWKERGEREKGGSDGWGWKGNNRRRKQRMIVTGKEIKWREENEKNIRFFFLPPRYWAAHKLLHKTRQRSCSQLIPLSTPKQSVWIKQHFHQRGERGAHTSKGTPNIISRCAVSLQTSYFVASPPLPHPPPHANKFTWQNKPLHFFHCFTPSHFLPLQANPLVFIKNTAISIIR